MFTFYHQNLNVANLEKSLAFYEEALGLKEIRRHEAKDGSFILVYLGDGKTDFTLELTWLRDHPQPYNLGECEFHLAFRVEDIEPAVRWLSGMGIETEPIREDAVNGGRFTFFRDPDGLPLELHE